jgi:hypothetical protein
LKWWRVYLGLFSLETLALLVINLNTGSAPSERIFLNLSVSRLILVAFLLILLILSCWEFWRTFKQQDKVQRFLFNAHTIFIVMIASVLATTLDLFLLSVNPKNLGELEQIYLNFKPFLIWGFIVGLQSALFSTTWFGYLFLGKQSSESPKKNGEELLAILGLFFLLVAVKMIFVLPSAYGPVIRGDEMRYFEMANYLYFGDFFIENINHSPFLYPLMLSIAFAFGEHTYDVIKLLNVIYSSSIVFPLFLIARKYFPKKESFLIAAAACFLPYHLLFPRVIMSENLYFPILLWVILFILHQPQSPRLSQAWSVWTGIVIGLLYMTRYITLAVIPFLLVAWWFIYPDNEHSVIRPSRRKSGMALLLSTGILCGYSPWLFSGLAANVPLKQLLGFGITANTTASQLTLNNLLIWLVVYLCYFILMAAPVLPFFFTFPISKFREWKKETQNWFILVAALLVGFLIACVRHSWRALYNGEIPTRIMGRYILYFTPLFIIAAFLALKESQSYRKTTFKKHLLFTLIFPFLLEVLAHSLLFGNLFHLHDGDLINILGSVDAAYFQYMGSYFFVLLLFIYGIICYLTWQKNTLDLISINLAAIMLFYLAGMPAYYQDLLSYQEYQFISANIVDLHQSSEEVIGDKVKIITPPDATERDRALLSNTFHFSNLDDFYVDSIENFNINKIPESDSDFQSIVIVKVKESDLLEISGGKPLNFGDAFYIILY